MRTNVINKDNFIFFYFFDQPPFIVEKQLWTPPGKDSIKDQKLFNMKLHS